MLRGCFAACLTARRRLPVALPACLQWVVTVATSEEMGPEDWQDAFDTLLNGALDQQ